MVVKSTGSWYRVVDSISGGEVQCRLKGNIRLKGSRATNPVVVGDVVDYEDDGRDGAVISAIYDRRNYIVRRSSNLSKESHIIAANIDQAFVVAALTTPATSYEFIDRFLVTAEAYNVPVIIILNKSDLYRTPELEAAAEEFFEIYDMAGYTTIEASATEGTGIEEIKALLKGKISLFSGNSGVGKSSILNAIDPDLGLRVGKVSRSHGKGMHTTTFSEMFPLKEGGYIIDTPGIKGFGLINIDTKEVARYFPDLFAISKNCSFYNCTHVHEPGCAVQEALEEGKIHPSRYVSYLKLLEEDGKYR